MKLSSDLISRFVKATQDTKTEKKTETTVYGTVESIEDDGIYVLFDGADKNTRINVEDDTAESTAEVAAGDRVIIRIKNHTATIIGNITKDNRAVGKKTASSTAETTANDFYKDNIVGKYVKTEELAAEAARITLLQADVVRIDDTLVADYVMTETMDAKISNLENVYAKTATVEELYAKKAEIEDVYAKSADVEELYAKKAEIEDVYAKSADVEELYAKKAEIEDVYAKSADVEELYAKQADVDNLEAEVADIDTLIFGSATGTTMQVSFANAVIALLGDAWIKSAMVDSVSASKITSGDIITNNVRVMSEDGHMLISDETIQISDDTRVRVQIGKDAEGDYSINIWDADGNLMFSEGGITDKAIKDAIIRNDMVASDANISASKLDIDSLFEEINGSTNTIKSTQIYLDDEKQTLDVAFKSLETTVTDQGETITSQGTSISTIQGQIESKVWQQDIDTATDEMSTQYSELEQNLDGFKTTVSETYATTTALSNVSNIATQAFNNTQIQADVTNYAQLNDDTASKWGFTTDDTVDGHWYTMDVLSRDKFISGWHQCVGTERFRVSFEISTSFMGNSTNGGTDSVYRGTAIGLYGYNSEGTSVGIIYSDRVMATADAPVTSVSCIVPVHSQARQFRVFVQTESFGNFSGSIKIRNVRVEKIDIVLEKQIEINETAISQNADAITAAAKRISDNEIDIASLELTAEGLTTRVSATETDINNLEIGGRNLFENSADLTTGAIGRYFSPEAPPYSITGEEDSAVPSGNCVVCALGEITTAITNGGFYLSGQFGQYIPKMVEGETYTVSVWTKGSRDMAYGAMTAEFLKNTEVINRPNLSTDWQRYIIRGVYNGNTTSSIAITFYYNTLIQSNDVFYFAAPQVEKGNRATDWTPAPEDMATAQEVNTAQATADEAGTVASNAETLVKQLSDSISMLVTDGNGTSLMTQTEDGWTFSTADIQSSVNDMSETLHSLTTEVGDVNNTVDILQRAVDDLGVIAEYVAITTYNDEPCIELGEGDSDFKLRITNTQMMFSEGSTILAYFTNQAFNSKKVVVEEELQQGGFIWKVRSNGNLGLTWKGGNS